MASSPTPGPWKASPFSSIVGCPITAQPDPKRNTVVIAGVHGAFGDDYRAEVEANARLIVTAVNERATLLATNAELVKALGNLHRECVVAAERAGTTWPLSGAAAALDAECREALALATVQP